VDASEQLRTGSQLLREPEATMVVVTGVQHATGGITPQ
jgi:hypothetical protein